MALAEKYKIGERFWRNRKTYNKHASVQKELCSSFATTLSSYNHSHSSILEIGCGTGFLTEEILQYISPQKYTANDISQQMISEIEQIIQKYNCSNFSYIAGDAEEVDFPGVYSTILTTSTIQWFYNLPEFFSKISKKLEPQGIFACSTFGLQNYSEIKEITGMGLDYYSTEELCKFLEKDFIILDCFEWNQEMIFKTPIDVLQHIKYTGVSGFGGRYFGKDSLQSFINSYSSKFAKDSGVRLTYNPIMIFAQKK